MLNYLYKVWFNILVATNASIKYVTMVTGADKFLHNCNVASVVIIANDAQQSAIYLIYVTLSYAIFSDLWVVFLATWVYG